MPDRVSSRLLPLALVAAMLVTPSVAEASDGWEVGILAGASTSLVVGLDVTFIGATATGLTYEDRGWAIAQVTWSVTSIVGAALAAGYAVDRDYPGLIGATALAAGGSAILLGYAIDALTRDDHASGEPAPRVGLSPMRGGGMLTLFGTL